MKKRHQKKAVKKTIISGTELQINSAGKLGRHIPTVTTGTGVQASKKTYNRKKEKASLRHEPEEDAFFSSSFLAYRITA